MAKKMKLKLDDLKVESFVTSLNDEEKKNINGGVTACQVDTSTSGASCYHSCTGTMSCG